MVERRWSLMSRPALLRAIEEKRILVSPYNKRNVRPNSIDVTFGNSIWRESLVKTVTGELPDNILYNPYDKESVKGVFKADKATALKEHPKLKDLHDRNAVCGISPDDEVVLIGPGESILGHTNEFIGSSCDHITTTMFARSSAGRNFLEVCRCAGQGDIGYCNRWTMEITNNSQCYTIPLVVGRRIAQIEFFETEPLGASYSEEGKYQTTADLDEMRKTWKPEDMLPKMYDDWEVIESGS